MKRLKLRTGEIVLLDDDWKEKVKKYLFTPTLQFDLMFKMYKGYVYLEYGNERFPIHRAILNYYGKLHVDHKDGNPLNNCADNLRLCTKAENSRNRKKSKNNVSGFKGVVKAGKKFTAAICYEGIRKHLGTFDTAEEAALAYDEAAVKYHGLFAKTNRELGLI